MKKGLTRILIAAVALGILLPAGLFAFFYLKGGLSEAIAERKAYRSVANQFKNASRKADMLVTDVSFDEHSNKLRTSVKFTEYTHNGSALEPKYFTFNGNVIQMQSMFIKLDGMDIDNARSLKDKTISLFWKAFLPDGRATKDLELTKMNSIPEAYRLKDAEDPKEPEIWTNIWNFTVDPERSDNILISNVTIRANDRVFIPGTIYELEIERNGKLKYSTRFLPDRD